MATGSDSLFSTRFRLGELLGTGGSSSVFAATDTVTGASVALKILHPHLSASERSREAFFAEARATTGLRHPNIAQVLGVGVHDAGEEPQAWIALELVRGVTLAEYVQRNGALDSRQVLTIASAVLGALGAAHARGLIHRDVSPANIMVDGDAGGEFAIGDVRLLDFGLADAAGRPVLGTDVLRSSPEPTGPAQGAGQVPTERLVEGILGSVNYMSPEQARGDAVDERGDLYQLGCVLYFALTGRPPFPRASAAAVMRAHARALPPVPSVLRARIPRAVDRIVVKALLKDPASRFQSAAEMMAAIDQASTSAVVGWAVGGGAVGGGAEPGPAMVTERTKVLAPAGAGDVTVIPVAVTTPRGGLTTSADRTGHIHVAEEASVRRPAGVPGPAWARSGRTRGGAGLWLAAMLVVVGVAVAWAAASGGSVPASIAVTSSTPTPAQTEVPAPAGITPSHTVRMPEVASLTLAAAREVLAATGLEFGAVELKDSARPADTVLGSLPPAGTRIGSGHTVDLVVASGANAIPTVLGLSRAAAYAALEEAGFVPLTETRGDSTATPGTVLASFPSARDSVRLGTPVNLIVAIAVPSVPEAPPATAPSPTSTPSPAPAPSPSATPSPAATPTVP
ncbi:hypothetical protein JF66_11190 [Cryobacterium sp. MLB-32]|uniref:protein kinase domain-containing protein n=1 Tax=Cryobacterium sp. MLB-32 TaxID=1529318 RepID=UPI0004E6C3E3|nr:protein kinase [Cryobacterium sp. MLB-32]KFF59446.1 hypothetical protein JF66_11190 [Cryobacterium sp. MLB-32]